MLNRMLEPKRHWVSTPCHKGFSEHPRTQTDRLVLWVSFLHPVESKGRPAHSNGPCKQWPLPVARGLESLWASGGHSQFRQHFQAGYFWGHICRLFLFRYAIKFLLPLLTCVKEFTVISNSTRANLAFQWRRRNLTSGLWLQQSWKFTSSDAN